MTYEEIRDLLLDTITVGRDGVNVYNAAEILAGVFVTKEEA